MDRMSPNFIYAFILTRSTLGLLHIIFRTFAPVKLPLIYAKISFPFNMLRANGHNLTKFYICIYIDKIYVGIVTHHFSLDNSSLFLCDMYQYIISLPKWCNLSGYSCILMFPAYRQDRAQYFLFHTITNRHFFLNELVFERVCSASSQVK